MSDLRDQITEALTAEHYRRAQVRIDALPEEHQAAFAEVALAVVQPKLDEQAARADRLATLNRELTAKLERIRDHIDSYPPYGSFVTSGCAEEFRAVLDQPACDCQAGIIEIGCPTCDRDEGPGGVTQMASEEQQ